MTPRDYLAGLEFHGIKLGLENIRYLAHASGDPQLRYPTVHVAGTNGKGSVVAFTASVLRAAGYKTGRFISPHLLDVSERFLIDGDPIPHGDLDHHIEFFRGAARGLSNPPTYFELCTAIAFRHFAENHVDIALIEVGMGGRFDSTNIIQPHACAITNIALDHQKYLGDTLAAIAFEKAGIIKPGVPVVVGERDPAPFDVIQTVARERNAPLIVSGRDFTYRVEAPKASTHLDTSVASNPLHPRITYHGRKFNLTDAPLGLAGVHQVENAALALALIETLPAPFSVSDGAALQGLRTARWPCRLERVLDDPPVYLDSAHNPAGIQRLVESMPPCNVVFAASLDKDVPSMLGTLARIAQRIIFTQFDGPRAMPIAQLQSAAGNLSHTTCASLHDAIRLGMESASRECPLLIAGSIFAAAQARDVLVKSFGVSPIQF